MVACDPNRWGHPNGGNNSSNSNSSSSSSSSSGSRSSCGAGMSVCSFSGVKDYCIPTGAFCCGKSRYWAPSTNILYGTCFNCSRGPSLNWGLYPRTAFFNYARSASCLDTKTFACNVRPR